MAKIVKQFDAKNPKSYCLRTHCQTSGWSLTEQEPYNNIIRTYVEAIAAVLGHTQSLHTNALDEAIALPTDFSARIARNTQLFLQLETEICRSIDPWAGSYYIEYLTHSLATRAWELISEVEELGGMAKAIESGIPKMRIEEEATRKQARIDAKKDIIVGVNYLKQDSSSNIEILEIDNSAVREIQIQKLKKLKKERNNQEVQMALDALTHSAKSSSSSQHNLLEKAIQAAQKKATLGEISYALEKVYGRYEANHLSVSGVYAAEMKNTQKELDKVRKISDQFAELEGRRARLMVAKMGQDGHDRGARVTATSFADMGFDVDIAPLFQSPHEVAMQAVQNDVHVLGISSLAGAHKTLVPQVIAELKKLKRSDICVVVGGVIPSQDYDFLYKSGAIAIFGPGTVLFEAATKILDLLIAAKK